MQAIDDGLLVGHDLVHVRVEIGNPVQRLLGRRDVVAPGREHDHRRAHVAQVDQGLAVGAVDLAGGQVVADEEVLDDPVDLLAVHQEVTAPPAFELKEARAFRVGLGVDVVKLFPKCVGRVELLEVLHQPRAVETAVTHVGGQRGEP
ncbi:hypothetical protein D3C86_1454860 [compost metagenome]